eukprot:1895459-Pyramimonas_sp.AAC.1
MLSCYNPTAERLDYLPISTPKSIMTLGMNTIKKIFHISSSVDKLPYVTTTFDSFICENNQWVPGWTRYCHGSHWPNTRALAK